MDGRADRRSGTTGQRGSGAGEKEGGWGSVTGDGRTDRRTVLPSHLLASYRPTRLQNTKTPHWAPGRLNSDGSRPGPA